MDKGPWSVGEFRRDDGSIELAVFSDDFKHDVMLRINGDFLPEDHRPYAEWLAAKLNQPATPPATRKLDELHQMDQELNK